MSRSLSKRSLFWSVWPILLDWTILFICFEAAIRNSNSAIVIVLVIFMVARTQHAFGVVMHEAVHGNLFKNKKLNDWVAQVLLGSPIFMSIDSYRYFHFDHHKAPMSEGDPDLSITGGYPIVTRSFVRKIFRDLSGQTYVKFMKYFTQDPLKKRPFLLRPFFQIGILVQLLLLAYFVWRGSPWLYFLVWLLPMLTVFVAMFRIRTITEHAGLPGSKNQAESTRTVLSPVYRLIFCPHNVNFHQEHHLAPTLPWYRLRTFYKERSDSHLNVYHSYKPVRLQLIRD